MLDKTFYTTILSQTFSSCGNFLLAGNSYGQIAIYNLEKLFNPKLDKLAYKNNAEHIFSLENGTEICSMATTDKFLIVGTHDCITGWDWNDVISFKVRKPAWTLRLPGKGSSLDPIDVNCLWWNEDLQNLFAGCGDSNVYSFNLEEGKLIRSFEAHSDYIHCVDGHGSNIISSGEDGRVMIWDTRSNKPSSQIVPHTHTNLSRPDLGKWIGAASLTDDWIVCGGGPRLALWQTRTLEASTVFNLPDHGIHVSYFHEDRVITAGAAKHLYQLNYTGETVVQIPVSPTTVYSAIYQYKPYQVFSIAGSSSNIDLCNNMNYKDQTLVFK